MFVVGALIGVLESSPAADVVDENCLEFDATLLHIVEQPLERFASLDAQATLAFVGVRANDFISPGAGVLSDCGRLVLG